jgi:helicase
MKVRDLERLGLPKRLIDVWRERQGEMLLPVQRQAISRGLLGLGAQPHNLIISAPTSSGKSFCAELAAAKAIAERHKVIMLFPLKSLAEEKYRELSNSFGQLGVRCLIVTADHPDNDQPFLRGQYDIALAIYEKLDILLSTNLDALLSVALIVIDELQMIAEPRRGAVLERALTKVLASCYHPMLLGLSAVMGHTSSQQLASWLDAELVTESQRPVDLLRGVATRGAVRFRSYNTGRDTSESFEATDDPDDLLTPLLKQLRESDGSTIVFVKSRRDTVDAAFRLASSVNWPSAKTAIEKLSQDEPSFLIRSLMQGMGRGVAFHNSDLSWEQRGIVEAAFVAKEIRVLFTTTTLALGVNLPADTVFLETVKFTSGEYGEQPGLVPISRAEFDNMTGRAGRLGCQVDRTGRAIVLAHSEFDSDILWSNYIDGESDAVCASALLSVSLDDWALHMITGGLAESVASLRHIWNRSYCACSRPEVVFDDGAVLTRLRDEGLITGVNEDFLIATSLGRAVASSGLTVRQGSHLHRQLEHNFPQTPLGWTALALSAPDWDFPPGILTRSEQRSGAPVRMLYQRFDHELDEITALLPEDHRKQPLTFRVSAMLKGVLLLSDWCRMVDLQRLEERYQMHLGQIKSISESAAHLVNGIASLIESSARLDPTVEMLRDHAFSLKAGMPADYRDMVESFDGLLNRADLIALSKAGITTLPDLLELSSDEVGKLISHSHKQTGLMTKIDSLKQEVAMRTTLNAVPAGLGSLPVSMEIDGSYEGDRYLVRINGLPVKLTGKSFKYLIKLAWSRLKRDAGWVYKEDIEIGFNQARYLYRMKNEIAQGFPSAWKIFENNRLGYYRLDLSPEAIRINFDNLRVHPDFEIRQMAEQVSPAPRPSQSGTLSASLPC